MRESHARRKYGALRFASVRRILGEAQLTVVNAMTLSGLMTIHTPAGDTRVVDVLAGKL